MVSLVTPAKAARKIAHNVRERRLQLELTQAGLAKRSGVPLPTLRKFEQQGTISLESFLKLYSVVGDLSDVIAATTAEKNEFTSINEVLEESNRVPRQRGKRQ